MSSSPDRVGRARLSIGLTGWFLLIFVITALGLYFLTSHLVRGALEEEWEVQQSGVEGRLSPSGEVEGVTVLEVKTKAVPTPEIQAAVRRQFEHFLPIVMIPIIVVGLLGGLFLTFHSTRHVRMILRTVREILSAG